MTITRRFLQLLTILIVFPLTAAIVGQANAKVRPQTPSQPERAQVVVQCMKDVAENGELESLALNQVCTCLTEKMGPKDHHVSRFLKQSRGRKEFGRCLFLAKDGL